MPGTYVRSWCEEPDDKALNINTASLQHEPLCRYIGIQQATVGITSNLLTMRNNDASRWAWKTVPAPLVSHYRAWYVCTDLGAKRRTLTVRPNTSSQQQSDTVRSYDGNHRQQFRKCMCWFKGNVSETGSQGLCAPIKGMVVSARVWERLGVGYP